MTVHMAFQLQVNGEKKYVFARNADTLLYVLRTKLGLTGAKAGCENGDCDTCTVLVNGWPIKACLMLAVEAEGNEITTVEGLQDTPIQQAFLEKCAVQCGFCTPGLIMNSHALVNRVPDADDETVNDWLASNLCRCMGYQEIKEAVKSVLINHEA